MRSRDAGAVRGSSAWVIPAAVLLAVASIVAVTSLQHRASSSRDAQVELGHVQRGMIALQSAPYDLITPQGGIVQGRAAQAGVLNRMEASESRIEVTLADLRSAHLTSHLDTLIAPYKANTAVLDRIRLLLIQGHRTRADALWPVAVRFQVKVDRELRLAGTDYEKRAAKSLRLAMLGSATMILALVSLFGAFYFRSRRAHALAERSHVVAERLARDNAQLLLHDSQLQVIQRLATAAEYRDDDTGQHTRRVGQLSVRIGTALGMPKEELLLLGQAAALHDVGKIGIPDSILLKRGRLTSEQFERMKAHTSVGAGMLAGRNFPLLEMAEEIALSHHERWDGSGYPAAIAGAAIPLVGRVVAVADVFDALTHSRPYKGAWSVAEAVTEISSQRGRMFDPRVVDAFLQALPQVLVDIDGEPADAASDARLRAVRAA